MVAGLKVTDEKRRDEDTGNDERNHKLRHKADQTMGDARTQNGFSRKNTAVWVKRGEKW